MTLLRFTAKKLCLLSLVASIMLASGYAGCWFNNFFVSLFLGTFSIFVGIKKVLALTCLDTAIFLVSDLTNAETVLGIVHSFGLKFELTILAWLIIGGFLVLSSFGEVMFCRVVVKKHCPTSLGCI